MKTILAGFAIAIAATAATPASAAQLDSLKGLMGGGNGALTSGTAGNAAGILQYCMANHYLGGDSGAAGVKDQLLGSLGARSRTEGTQDKGYQDGAKGLLRSGTARCSTFRAAARPAATATSRRSSPARRATPC
jgi:hypothetical protein